MITLAISLQLKTALGYGCVIQTVDEKIYLVRGGFHLKNDDKRKIEHIVKTIKEVGELKVAPSHCTGDKAIEYFRDVYQDNFVKSCVGKRIKFDYLQ